MEEVGGGRGCRGARGDSGMPGGIILGDKGSELMAPAVSLGMRGKGEPRGRSMGRGLIGKPGLLRGAIRCRGDIVEES